MTAYLFYTIDKEEVINLAKKFNELRNRIQFEYITIHEFSNYANQYFEAISKKFLGFDYVLYGSVLLNAKVVFSDSNNRIEYEKIISMIYIYLHRYGMHLRNKDKYGYINIENAQCIKYIDINDDAKYLKSDDEIDDSFVYKKKI